MPEKQEHRTKLNGRVRIKDEATNLYPKARTENEGYVRRQMHDEYGYPIIFIEWDKDHWAYSGEEDRYALDAHFDPVEEDMAEKNEDLAKALSEFLKGWQDGKAQDEPDEPELKPDNRPTEELGYSDLLKNAVEDAEEGEAYIVFIASKNEFGGTEMTVPHVYTHHKREDAALLLDAAVADYIAQLMVRMASQEIQRRREEDGSSSS